MRRFTPTRTLLSSELGRKKMMCKAMEARSKVMLNPQTYSTRESTKCAGQFGGTRCSAWWDGSFHLDGKEEGEVEVEGDGALKTRPSPSAPANYLTGRWAILEIDFARLTYKCTHLCLPPVVLSPWAQLLKGRQRDGRRHTHTHTEGEKKKTHTIKTTLEEETPLVREAGIKWKRL